MVNNGFDMVNNKSIFIQRKITMQERHLFSPYSFPWSRSAPPVISF